jgi:hypothetical protein
MSQSRADKPYFKSEPQFDTWFDKDLVDGSYEGDEGALTEWYNGVHWNTRIRIKGGGPQITDDLVVEGCNQDRAAARQEAEKLLTLKLMTLLENAGSFGFRC